MVFHPQHCIIQDSMTSRVRGVGKAVKGVYYLINEPLNIMIVKLRNSIMEYKDKNDEGSRRTDHTAAANTELKVPTTVEANKKKIKLTTIWHCRLGYAPLDRIMQQN